MRDGLIQQHANAAYIFEMVWYDQQNLSVNYFVAVVWMREGDHVYSVVHVVVVKISLESTRIIESVRVYRVGVP